MSTCAFSLPIFSYGFQIKLVVCTQSIGINKLFWYKVFGINYLNSNPHQIVAPLGPVQDGGAITKFLSLLTSNARSEKQLKLSLNKFK